MGLGILHNFKSIKYLFSEVQQVAKRFPLALIAAFFALVGFSFFDKWEEAILPLTLTLGIPLFIASTLYRESKGWNSFRSLLIEFMMGLSF